MTEAEDKEKAEKLAAAKKRFEELKKQKNKKGGAKKKGDKVKADADAEASSAAEKQDEAAADEQDDGADGPGAAAIDASKAEGAPHEVSKDTSKPSHGRTASISTTRKVSSDTGMKSPAGETAQDIHRKQAQRIEQLEKENKKLQSESEAHEKKWRKTEDELEELREARGEVEELKSKAGKADERDNEIENLKTEITALQRQIPQLQSQASRSRRISTSSPANADDLTSQLASKANTIDSLELELFNLHTQLSTLESKNTDLSSQLTTLEDALSTEREAHSSTAKELADLRTNLESASTRAESSDTDKSALTKQIAQLEASLAASQRTADAASKRASTLDQKVSTLTTLHRDASTAHAARQRDFSKTEREAKELRSRVSFLAGENSKLRSTASHGVTDDDGTSVDELVDEARETLRRKVRELEEENAELRRGVWRDRRRELQPGLDDDNDADTSFDDVDLTGRASPRAARPGVTRGSSSLTDVINSGIKAFSSTGVGGGRRRGSSVRKQSLGHVSEDGDEFAFDEEEFKRAQEEENMRRLERVREIKRGLVDWKGWRVDLVHVRAGMGGVFDV
ncbi:hypothetical protein EJ05DRAFT_529408 [Pseudovirgaria hyperparasitica]|uniref:Periplakin-like plectin repeat domain-containing protein n=1 Tax=Pseudovirgaria hyperparasitica TaxID=470096 RepID=A0A6A6W6H9_9PEZI|nr:uncharacterized protein EJ05DRAFT_529408 [Pseudovirgaria hyperparasitica]KAF2757634.1 hypothetical protein EJ05DRAFT_529408 [Pseudovirgaria hyperparasitica]